jgi:mannitol-1-/sugar-/sorbitol-6-phosphatase
MPLDDIHVVTGPPLGASTTEVSVNGLFFDLDGVLVDSAATIERHWREFASWYGIDAERLVQGTHGRRAADTIMGLERELPVPAAEALDRYESLDASDHSGVRTLPGAAEILSIVSGCKWAIVTSGSPLAARGRLSAVGLPVPPVLITAHDVVAGKPDPAPYGQAAALLGVNPHNGLAIEDSPPGLESARSAGCKTLGITTTHDRRQLGPADFVCSDLGSVVVLHADKERVELRLRLKS